MRAAQYLIDTLEMIKPEQLNELERKAWLTTLEEQNQVLNKFLAGCGRS